MQYFLSVHQVNDACIFGLRWGTHEQTTVTVPVLADLAAQYQRWQGIYLNFYRNQLRGKPGASGAALVAPVDWHSRLVEAEGQLLSRFHHWLRSPELFPISTILQKAIAHSPIDLFLTCSPLDLARLPWEAWELGYGPAGTSALRIVRTPLNLGNAGIKPATTYETSSSKTSSEPAPGMTPAATTKHNHRPRVLIILGDDTGLSLTEELTEITALLHPLTEVVSVGWRQAEHPSPAALREAICQAIADPQGWDILFFAGHSNEADNLGGQIGIAPNVWLYLSEILPYLKTAKEKGLKFAFFNSCQGLDIAESFLELGLGQVAIMREAIHHRVALAFLKRFLFALSEHQTVQMAMLSASQAMKSECSLTYPSASLIPSFFLHPAVTPYQLPERDRCFQWRNWLPRKQEALWLSGLMLLSLAHPVETLLLEARTAAQALYRQATFRLSAQRQPPVLLVQVDKASLDEAEIHKRERNPLNRSYLASVLEQVQTLQPKLLGINYIWDQASPSDQAEQDQALQQQLNQLQSTSQLVLGALSPAPATQELPESLRPKSASSSSSTSLQLRHVLSSSWMMELPGEANCDRTCPFAYQLALNALKNADTTSGEIQRLRQTHLSQLGKIAERWGQSWFNPILDFSIPSEQVYQTVSAKDLSQLPADFALPSILILAPGGYPEAGSEFEWSDNESLPLALSYWRQQARASRQLKSGQFASDDLTGAEAHAYMIHHFLTDHYVIGLPAFVFIILAAIASRPLKGMGPKSEQHDLKPRLQLLAGLMIYGWLSLEIYISLGVLLPWFLPALTFKVCRDIAQQHRLSHTS